MLPSYGGGYGSRRQSGGSAPMIVSVVLSAGLVLAAWGLWSLSSQAAELRNRLDSVKAESDRCQTQATHSRTSYQHMDHQLRTAERQLAEAKRQIQIKDLDLNRERNEKEAECQGRIEVIEDRMKFEKDVNEALQKHMHSLEEAHKNREADWHLLAAKWTKYEEDAVAENHRLLSEVAELKNLTMPSSFEDPTLPYDEPKDRPETKFDADFHTPEYHYDPSDRFKHKQQPLVPEGQQGEQLQQPQQPDVRTGAPSTEEMLEQLRRANREEEEAYREQHGVPYPNPEQPQHRAPEATPPGIRHHADVYSGHYEDNWNDWNEDQNPLDPMDHYWMHDGFDEGHDNFHGGHSAHPPPHHDDGSHHYDDWHDSVNAGGQAPSIQTPEAHGDYIYDQGSGKWIQQPQVATETQQQQQQLNEPGRHEGQAPHHGGDGSFQEGGGGGQHPLPPQQQQHGHAPEGGHGDGHANPRWHSGSHEHGQPAPQQQQPQQQRHRWEGQQQGQGQQAPVPRGMKRQHDDLNYKLGF